MRVLLMAVASAGALLGAVSQASATTIVDGDFSTPSGGASFTEYSAGSSFSAWSVTSGSVDLIGGYWQAPPLGGGSVDLDGSAPGAISQTFTAPAGEYTLKFFLSGNPDGGNGVKTLDVSAGGASTPFSFTNDGTTTKSAMGYVAETLTFYNAGTTTLTFASTDASGPYGAVIGDVSVSAIPEPASWAIMLVGFGGLGASIRSARRRRSLALAAA